MRSVSSRFVEGGRAFISYAKPEIAQGEQRLYAAIYTTTDGYSSALGLNNSQNHPITCWVTLYNKHGAALTVPPITLDAHRNHAFNNTINDSFTTFLMFKPDGVPGTSIWVPLRKVNWSWGGTASFTGSQWQGSNLFNSTNPTDADAPSHALWTTNAAAAGWQ